jgi:hypothetical protein
MAMSGSTLTLSRSDAQEQYKSTHHFVDPLASAVSHVMTLSGRQHGLSKCLALTRHPKGFARDEYKTGKSCARLALAFFAVTDANQSWFGIRTVGQLAAEAPAGHDHLPPPFFAVVMLSR